MNDFPVFLVVLLVGLPVAVWLGVRMLRNR